MAEERSGSLEMGAEMDYSEHERTYSFFLSAAKWGTIVCVSLLIAMAAGFFGGLGLLWGTVLFLLLCVGAFFFLR